ncbi:hypothetical protein ACTFIZ_001987 [Dictyostelium cf. discoideum]
MSTNKKIKTDNNKKLFQDIIDYEILKFLINYLLTSKNNNNQYRIDRLYFNLNEILNYILVSKKWYNYISLTISNNIIDNKLFEHWFNINIKNKTNPKSFIENYNNNKNLYEKKNKSNKIRFIKKFLAYKIAIYKFNFNKEFSIIKIQESIINDYFKFNLFLKQITMDDFKEIKNRFENNQLFCNRIVANVQSWYGEENNTLFEIQEYVSNNENSKIISNLFKILELSYDWGFVPISEEDDYDTYGGDNNKLYLNKLSIKSFRKVGAAVQDGGPLIDLKFFKFLKNFKAKNIFYNDSIDFYKSFTQFDYSFLFDPYNSGQQVESIKVRLCDTSLKEIVEPHHLIKVDQFENLHTLAIQIGSFQILSSLSREMGFIGFRGYENSENSKNMKSKLNQMIKSILSSKSLKNLQISSVDSIYHPIDYDSYFKYHSGFYMNEHEIFVNRINENVESFSNCFKPLFSELNTTIERIKLDSMGLLNINTFSNLLNNKSIKYLYLYSDSDFMLYCADSMGCGRLFYHTFSINQYLFENIFSSPLTSIRHYKIRFKELNQLKFIFNLLLNNIFKLQLYSLIFEFNEVDLGNEFVKEFIKEYKNLIYNISIQQQQQKSNIINLREIKIKLIEDENIQELNNISCPYFVTLIKYIKNQEYKSYYHTEKGKKNSNRFF